MGRVTLGSRTRGTVIVLAFLAAACAGTQTRAPSGPSSAGEPASSALERPQRAAPSDAAPWMTLLFGNPGRDVVPLVASFDESGALSGVTGWMFASRVLGRPLANALELDAPAAFAFDQRDGDTSVTVGALKLRADAGLPQALSGQFSWIAHTPGVAELGSSPYASDVGIVGTGLFCEVHGAPADGAYLVCASQLAEVQRRGAAIAARARAGKRDVFVRVEASGELLHSSMAEPDEQEAGQLELHPGRREGRRAAMAWLRKLQSLAFELRFAGDAAELALELDHAGADAAVHALLVRRAPPGAALPLLAQAPSEVSVVVAGREAVADHARAAREIAAALDSSTNRSAQELAQVSQGLATLLSGPFVFAIGKREGLPGKGAFDTSFWVFGGATGAVDWVRGAELMWQEPGVKGARRHPVRAADKLPKGSVCLETQTNAPDGTAGHVPLHVIIAPDGQRTWVVGAYDRAIAIDKAREIIEGGCRAAKRPVAGACPDLERLWPEADPERTAWLGYTTLAGLAQLEDDGPGPICQGQERAACLERLGPLAYQALPLRVRVSGSDGAAHQLRLEGRLPAQVVASFIQYMIAKGMKKDDPGTAL